MATTNEVLDDLRKLIQSGEKIKNLEVVYGFSQPISTELQNKFIEAGYDGGYRYLTLKIIDVLENQN